MLHLATSDSAHEASIVGRTSVPLPVKNNDAAVQLPLVNAFGSAQATYGNQAVLRMLGQSSSPPILQPVRSASQQPVLQRKCGRQSEGEARGRPFTFFSRYRSESQPATEVEDECVPEKPPEGSGTCVIGQSASGCDNQGNYSLRYNGNKCCTTICTDKHEAEHKKDHDAWGCCKAYGVALSQPSADKTAINEKYFSWLKSVEALTEFHAYSAGAECAKNMSDVLHCADAGNSNPCCQDVIAFEQSSQAAAECYGAKAPAVVPPCPVF